MEKLFLSIIIPAHNEESRLPGTLAEVDRFLQAQSYTYEVLVVENGSSDRTLELAHQAAANMPYLRVLHEDGRGKGLAVKVGMLAAQGEHRFICDADLSMPITEVNHFLPPLAPKADIVIGSREAPGAIRYNEPAFRHLTGRAFNNVVRWLALPGLQDTQCGFKCFSAQAAKTVFPLQTITGWSFDVEVLYIARRHGFTIEEIPIPWYFNSGSKVNVLRDLRQVMRDLWRIYRNSRSGRYG